MKPQDYPSGQLHLNSSKRRIVHHVQKPAKQTKHSMYTCMPYTHYI